MSLQFTEMIELKGRNGSRSDWKFRIGVWLAKRVLTALANDPRLRKELAAIMSVISVPDLDDNEIQRFKQEWSQPYKGNDRLGTEFR